MAAYLRTAMCLLLVGASRPAARAEDSPCKPETWNGAIAEFEKQDAADPPPQNAAVFVGSSSIRMWDLSKSFPETPAINRGFGGSQACDAAHFAEQLVIKHRPRVVVFYSGDNDIAAGKTAEQVHRDVREFVGKVRKALPETTIVIFSIKPSIARWKLRDAMQAANKLVAADAAEKDSHLVFLDVWPAMLGDDGEPRKELFREDGLHMNDEGYKLWSEMLQPHLAADN
jgi:lysophospholipase L1-like esterase